MASEEQPVNDTLINMITNLKPKIKSDLKSLDSLMNNTESPLKRSFSSSGLFDYVTPAKKSKADSSTDYIASPNDARRLRAHLLEARNTIVGLENRIQHMHSVRKEMEIMYQNEVQSLQQQHNYDKKTLEDLETQLQTIRKHESEVKKDLSEAKTKFDELKISTDRRIEELEKQLSELKTNTAIESDLKKEELSNLKHKIEELEVVMKAAQEDAEAHKKLSAEIEKRLSEKTSIERDLEMKDQALQKARLDLKEFQFIRDNYTEYQQQIKTHQQKLAAFSNLEKENQQLKEEARRLKDSVSNKLLLEEEVHDLKNRLVNYKELEKKYASLQAHQVQNDLYLNEWRALARSICECSGPDSTLVHLLRGAVERLQQQEINLTSDKVQLESQLNSAIHDAKVARSELEKNQKHIVELQTSVQHRQNLIHRMQKKLQLVSSERDSYRQHLDSYERDLTMCTTSTNSMQTNAQQTQRERIEALERCIQDYRDMVAKLEGDLQKVEPNTDAVPVRAEQLSSLHKELDRLKMDNSQLRKQRDQLQEQLEQYIVGSDNTSGRIVHLAMNPVSECISEHENVIEKLQEEIQRLKSKIRKMEEGLEASKLNESLGSNPKEVQALKDQVKSYENQLQRLKDYFKSSMQEFRNVTYMLLGYKIDKASGTTKKYKLTSMYAEKEEDQIHFLLNTDGSLNLLENKFSAGLDDMVDLHLRKHKSIPVFLSALTMDLFNNRTVNETNVYVEEDEEEEVEEEEDDDDGDD